MDCFGGYQSGGRCLNCEYHDACEYSKVNPRLCEEKPFFETIAFLGAIKGEEREKGRDMGMEGGL